uniref:ERCC4 domain-containing protein n=1 Tax=Globisporangium ultimum (strain ATCC 200006 / CBS 805.95 / DAOM BR144) TaxID=431595 RepID=K3WYP1_GLOUD
MPSCVILYDPDVTFIRELEVFQATQVNLLLDIYFMLYEESAEQQAYLSEIQKEKRAFDTLIHQKAHLMMPANVYDLPFHMKMQQNQQMAYSMDTRTGGRAKTTQKPGVKVVVDVREFRSALPSMLHKEGLMVLPITLEIGDYILSPQICVERKSISDLFGSLNSGRLFNQAENMRRFYQTPVLLIEFTQGKAFSLQDASEIGTEITATNIISKLTLLILHFPSLRIVWSRSPHATVELFKVIKKHQDEPDMETAAALGNGTLTESAGSSSTGTDAGQNGGGSGTTSTTRAGPNSEEGRLAASYYNTNAMDVLKKLPGINEHNFRKVLAKVTNLAELSRLSLDEMTEIIGKVCAKKLFTFFNTSL